MQAGPTGHVRNFKAAGPPNLIGTIAANLEPLEPTEEERMAVYGLVHQDELHMSTVSPWTMFQLSEECLLALMEQRGLGLDVGYARGVRRENPTRFAELVQVGRSLQPEAVDRAEPLQVPVSDDVMLTRPLELDAAALSELTVGELQYRLWLRVGDMPGLRLEKKMLVKMLLACERTRQRMQEAIRLHNPNMPLRLPPA